MKNRTLIYFIDEIDSSFVRNDIERMASNFDTVFLFSVEIIDKKQVLPSNVRVIEAFIDWSDFRPLSIFLRNLLNVLRVFLKEYFRLKMRMPAKAALAVLISNVYKANSVVRALNSAKIDYTSATFYSFWFYDCIFLAWIKMKWRINQTVIRAHGGDLFEERGSLKGRVLFRDFQLRFMNGVFPVSETGTRYLRSRYPKYSRKINTVYLGSPFHNSVSPFSECVDFVLVSCATVRNIKRIHLIAEMLFHVDFPLTWFHIGNENLEANDPTIPRYLAAKQRLLSHEFVRYIPMGELTSRQVFDFYEKNSIHLFISLSEAEGLPVSILEALSFGIPVLSTDVGGCSEIVTDQTGFLVHVDTEAAQIANVIREFRLSTHNSPVFRKGVRKFWEGRFNTDDNYRLFFSKLEALNE